MTWRNNICLTIGIKKLLQSLSELRRHLIHLSISLLLPLGAHHYILTDSFNLISIKASHQSPLCMQDDIDKLQLSLKCIEKRRRRTGSSKGIELALVTLGITVVIGTCLYLVGAFNLHF